MMLFHHAGPSASKTCMVSLLFIAKELEARPHLAFPLAQWCLDGMEVSGRLLVQVVQMVA